MALVDTVNDLPAELLLDIFRLVFTADYFVCSPKDSNCMTCRRIGTHHVAWGPTEAFNQADPALFPYALAAALPRWRAILATVPEYWTRPVFFVDDPPTSVADISDFLRYSNNLPIEVYITRRNFHSDNTHEQERVRAVIDALKPHLSRCQYLFIHVSRSSSLPSVPCDFTGTAPYLTQLKLDCEVDDGINAPAYAQPPPKEPFCCPALYTLLIDGPNFREIAMNHSIWWTYTFNTSRSLIIRNLTSSPLSFDLALACLNLYVLGDLRLFTLSNVSFDTKDIPAVPPWTYTFNLQMLILSQTPFPFLSYFFKHTFLGDLYSIRIESCTFPSSPTDNSIEPNIADSIIPNTFSLTLKNVTHSSHFISLLRTWRGQRLNIDSSPGFDDSVLAVMCSPIQGPRGPSSSSASHHQNDVSFMHYSTTNMLGCPHLSILYLMDCTNFTPGGIKRLVEVRNSPRGDASDSSGGGTSEAIVTTGVMELITVVGHGPRITAAERDHFDGQHTVKWDAT